MPMRAVLKEIALHRIGQKSAQRFSDKPMRKSA